MASDTPVQLGAALVLVGSLGASVVLTQQIASSVGRHGLAYTDRAEEGAPEEVAIGIALGAFRGMFVNMLWMRAQAAKDRGDYYEAMDLAKAITKLQPRFPRVWAFHAWNMAYNISVTTHTAEERWQWVNNGIRLHREQAIPANPKDLLLHRELSWIFLHKIQGFMDDANLYYKRALAEEWTIVLGPPRPADPTKANLGARTTEQATSDAVYHLTRILEAPDDLDEIVQRLPAAAQVLEVLRTDGGFDLRTNDDRMRFLRMLEFRRAILRVGSSLPSVGVGFPDTPLMRALNDPALAPVWETLVPHVRKRLLADKYHMEVDRMIKYCLKYGPLDWRHPATHALYWGTRGVDEALEKVTERNREDYDFLNADRVSLQALQELYRSGTLQFDILHPTLYLAMPSVHFIPGYRAVLDDMVEREWTQMKTKGAIPEQRPFNLYAAGYENFMKDAICFLYRRGDKEGAQRLKTQLVADYDRNLLNKNDPRLREELLIPLDEFVVKQIEDRLTTPNVAVHEITGSLYGAFISGLLQGDNEAFAAQLAYAKQFHGNYMKEQFRDTGVDQERARMEQLPRDFRDCAAQIFVACIAASGLENGSIMYNRAPADLRQWSYELLQRHIKPEIDQMVAASAAPGAPSAADAGAGQVPGFERWFPRPDGLELYQAQRAAENQAAPTDAERVRK
ncbi:MAG: hypothetical protein AB7K52_10085 [Phycisphaerales bacterium]